mmetsp:Transcript_11615/g.13499  ORF Transcript_11615/g.13499 Transcript_11615/m.13499 type:complete len:113 (+) Transcript_11615:782-1120(+)
MNHNYTCLYRMNPYKMKSYHCKNRDTKPKSQKYGINITIQNLHTSALLDNKIPILNSINLQSVHSTLNTTYSIINVKMKYDNYTHRTLNESTHHDNNQYFLKVDIVQSKYTT